MSQIDIKSFVLAQNIDNYKLKFCPFPMRVYYTQSLGKKKLIWKKSDPRYGLVDQLQLPCSKCLFCQKKYSSQWAVRCVLESTHYKNNCFITLTYNNESIDKQESLVKRDYQLFIKRLRKYLDQYDIKIKYFIAGEYGDVSGRPHYHLLVFGWKPHDMKFKAKSVKGSILYYSNFVQEMWGKGFVDIGDDLDVNTVRYVCKYMQKLKKLKPNCIPSFVAMSKGIAKRDFKLEIYDNNGIYLNGVKYSVPRYFDKLAEKNGIDLTLIKQRRIERMQKEDLSESDYILEQYKYYKYCIKQNISVNHIGFLLKYKLDDFKKGGLFSLIDEIGKRQLTLAEHGIIIKK